MRSCPRRRCFRFYGIWAGVLAILAWVPTAQAVSATGGDITTNYTYLGATYRAHIFTNVVTTNLTVTGSGNVSVLVVAGGGGGGNGLGGGGGAGGLIYTSSFAVVSGVSGSNYVVTVGSGGAGALAASAKGGSNGLSSVFGPLTASGGGGGAGFTTGGGAGSVAAGSGGSGGGGLATPSFPAYYYGGAASPAGQGYAGGTGGTFVANYPGGGGGGAGAVGGSVTNQAMGGNGGIGKAYPQFASVGGDTNFPGEGWFAGGGGGGLHTSGTPGTGGKGGGGTAGATNVATRGFRGQPNTGGGGGSGSYVGTYGGGGTGGCGIVIVMYEDAMSLHNLFATNVTDTSADLIGNLTSTGASPTTVWTFWDTTDHTTNKTWAYSTNFVSGSLGAITNPVSGILSNQTYFFTYYTSNTEGEVWAQPSLSFKTWGPLSVDNDGGATEIGFTTATLRGTLLSGSAAYASVMWGTSELSLTSTSTPVWVTEGVPFSVTVTGLATNTTYYYHCFVSNAYGTATASTTNFTTATTATTWQAVTATGGDITTNTTYNGVTYRVHVFTNIGTTNLTVNMGGNVQVLVVAGGGGGGNGTAGGGGAGGLIYTSSFAVVSGVSGSNYVVTVGRGGVGAPAVINLPASNGSDSVFGSLTAVGGGKGSSWNLAAGSGGSGGGGNASSAGNRPGGAASPAGQGYAGGTGGTFVANYPGGGGGGAGAVGANGVNPDTAGAGGIGRAFPQFASMGGDTNFPGEGWFAGGGGGGVHTSGTPGLGGKGGGGTAGPVSASPSQRGSPGQANTGGGGGSGFYQGGASSYGGGGTGGCGIVIIMYEDATSLRNLFATNVTETTADLVGSLSSTGASPTTVWTFWGTTDHTTNKTWAYSTNYVAASTGMIANPVSGLLSNQTYFFTYYASNTEGEVWAQPSLSFKTLGHFLSVDNGSGATHVGWSSATLHGAVQGYPPAIAYLYWGPVDQETNRELWQLQNEILIGPATDLSFSTNISVAMGSINYYRCFASNAYGQAWAYPTVAFTSPVAVPANIQSLVLESRVAIQNFSIVFDGNSWIAGSGSTGGSNFPNQTVALLTNAGRTVSMKNYGVAGQTTGAMQADALTQIDPNHTNYDFLIGLELVNEWGLSTTYTKEQLYSRYKQYFLDRKAAGFKYVYACTPHDQAHYGRTSGGDWATVRAYFIAQMKAEFPSLGIGVIDCGSDPRLSDWTDTTYFSADKIHLKNAGQAVQAQYAYNALMSSAGGSSLLLALTGSNTSTYTLQQAPVLTPAAWENVLPYTNLTGLGSIVITNGLSTNSTMFFRVICIETTN